MANDYYADAAPPKAAAPKEPTEPADSQTAELPLAVFPEKPKVGDVCDFEVVQLGEKSAVVRYATDEKEEPTQPETEAPASSGAGGMNSMYE